MNTSTVKAVIYTQADCISASTGDFLFSLPKLVAGTSVWMGESPGSVLIYGTPDLDSIERILPHGCTLERINEGQEVAA